MNQANIPQALQEKAYSPRIADRLPAVIFSDTNERAYDLLNSVKRACMIPGTYFTTLTAIADYYDVSESYLRGVFQRNEINRKDTPDDVLHLSLSDFLKLHDVKDRVRFISEPLDKGVKYICDASRDAGCHKVCIPNNNSAICFYSARAFLAAAKLMYYGRSVSSDSVAAKVLGLLKRSSYMEMAKAIHKPSPPEHDKTPAVSATETNPAETSERQESTIQFILTEDVLQRIVQGLVKDEIAGFMRETFGLEKGKANTNA